jgi:hypothetical protein
MAKSRICVTNVGSAFPVRYIDDVNVLTDLDGVRAFARYQLEKVHSIFSHESNWQTIALPELLVVVSVLQAHGAPPLSRDPSAFSVGVEVKDGLEDPPVHPYAPNCVLIAPSSIPGAGAGAFTRIAIPPDYDLGAYFGTYTKSQERMKEWTERQDNEYVFSIYDPDTGAFLCGIDAKPLFPKHNSRTGKVVYQKGSWQRFVNCSDEHHPANAEYGNVFGATWRSHRVILTTLATRGVPPGEELLANYYS